MGLPTYAGHAVISADAHVDEPHDLWYDRLDGPLRERAPRRIEQGPHGAWELVLDGQPLGWIDVTADDAAKMEQDREAEITVDARTSMMATDGVAGEIVYPTIGLFVWNLADGDLGRACCDVYNDWIRERLGAAPERVKLAGLVPTWTVADAVAGVETNTEAGFAAHMLPLVGTPEWNHPQWEPLWDAIEASGAPAAMHQGTGHDMIFYRGPGSPTANLLATQSMAPRAAGLLAASGVLDRHPRLRVVFVEVNAGWLAWTMSTLDEYHAAHAHWSKPALSAPPSQFLRTQIHATFQQDPVAVANRDRTGVAPLLWGNDYPHPESTYPDSRAVLDRLLGDLTESDAAAIAGGNAARVFGFDL
jgi:predicted TIM-barrel fold metal-dependent hydrolase